MQLNDGVIKSMARGRVFKDNERYINSMDFHRKYDLLVTADDDDTINVYNTFDGECIKVFRTKKYGCSNVCFTHHQNAIIYASTHSTETTDPIKVHAIRYHSLHDNHYLRYFSGHVDRVTSLSFCPKDDHFLSAGQDKTVRLWDLRSPSCEGCLETPGQPCVAFDQQGLVFAVGTESGIVKLYDLRQCDKGPFATFTVKEEVNSPAAFSMVAFSNDGNRMIAVTEGRIHVLDAFHGTLQRRFVNGIPDGGTPVEACFSPDGQYVLSGCEDKTVRVWNVNSGSVVETWRGHAGQPNCVKWAPTRVLVATACQGLVFWVPPQSATAP